MKKLLLALAMCSLTASIQAQSGTNDKFYMGGSVGSVKADTGISGLTGTARLDEKDTGYKLYFGYKIDQTFSTELQYADFGEAELSGNNGDTFVSEGTRYQFNVNNAKITVKSKSYGASILAGTNITEAIRPFVRVGLHRWDAKSTVTAGSSTAASEKDTGTDLFYGVGLDVQLMKNVYGRIEAERYKVDSDKGDFISAGIRFTF
jgi:opacity protein-like surface antigen